MRCSSLVLVLTAGLGGIASAQPGPPPQPPDTSTTTTTTGPEPGPPAPVTTTTTTTTPTPAPTPVVHEEPAPDTGRPEGFSIGLGLGYGLPTSLETPNRTSARFRLASGLTIEPLVSIANTSQKMDTAAMETEDKTTEFGLAALVRYPVISRGHVDLEALGAAGFTTTKDNPEGDFNTRTTNTFALSWGVGIGYWLSQHWQLSMSVTNPLIEYTQTKQAMGPDMSNTTSTTTVGVIFVPQVVAMIHLYY